MIKQREIISLEWGYIRQRLGEAYTSLMDDELETEYWKTWSAVHRIADYCYWITDQKLIEEEFKVLPAYKDKELTDEFILEASNRDLPLAKALIEKCERIGAM